MTKIDRVVVIGVLGLVILPAVAIAEVERIEMTSREVFADGQEYGSVGAYEKIRGKLFYAVDPDNAANAAIVDLDFSESGKLLAGGDALMNEVRLWNVDELKELDL